MDESQIKARNRSRLSLILLVLVFVAPIILAFIVSKNKSLQPENTKNYGELVQPASPLPEFSIKTIDDKPFTLQDMQRKWSLVYLADGQCDNACQESLVKMRDARLAQSGEALRVQYYLVFTAPPVADGLTGILEQHPRLNILQAGESSDILLKTFQGSVHGQASQTGNVYLVDPIGNVMMYYPPGFKGNGLVRDLKHLLHWSQIG